jgi:hypothetical protein
MRKTTRLPVPVKVHLGFDMKMGKWRWWMRKGA